MPRRKTRLNAAAPHEQVLEKYLLKLSNSELFHDPERFPKMSSASWFGNDHPMELEVGSGTGEFLCALARKEPGTNFVGIDVHKKSLHNAAALASSFALRNIVFVSADFKLMYPLLAPQSLHCVYLHFPDPNVKRKFRNRRIFSARFLDEVHRALGPKGRLSVMTDHRPYFFEMLQLAERDQRWSKGHADRYVVGFEPLAKSRFQLRWERHGLATLRFELIKASAASTRGGIE